MRRAIDVVAALVMAAAGGVATISGFASWHPGWLAWLEIVGGCGAAWVLWRYVTDGFKHGPS